MKSIPAGPPAVSFPLLVCCTVLCLFSCTDDDVAPVTPVDDTAPARILDLTAAIKPGAVARLAWTAPGDDDMAGTATQYDVRVSSAPPVGSAWPGASAVTVQPTPHIAGTGEVLEVPGLLPGVFYFAIRTADEVPHWSAWSNAVRTEIRLLCGIEPDILDFGLVTIGQDSTRSFRIRNEGELPLVGSVPAGSGDFAVTTGAGPFTIELGDSLIVGVRFAPSSPREPKIWSLYLGQPICMPVLCSGVGSAPPPPPPPPTAGTIAGTAALPPGLPGDLGNARVGLYTSMSNWSNDIPARPFGRVVGSGPNVQIMETGIAPGSYLVEVWSDTNHDGNFNAGDWWGITGTPSWPNPTPSFVMVSAGNTTLVGLYVIAIP